MKAAFNSLVAAGIAVIVAGCAFAPPAKPPAAPAPAGYTAEPSATVGAQADGVAQRFHAGGPAMPEWWRQYGSATLDGWVDEGLRNNPTLKATQHTLEALRQQLRAQVGETRLPALDLQAQSNRQRALGVPNFGPPTNVYDVYAGQLSLSYTFDLFGATRYGIKQTAAGVDQQAYQLEAARRALAANLVISAIQASALAEQVVASERLSALAQEQAELTEKAYRLGAASQDEVLAAQQNAASLQASLPPLRAQAQRARHALAVWMGRTPDQAPAPLPLAQLQLPAEIPLSLPSELLQQRPDVMAAEALVHAASAQVGVATANLFPRIGLSASLGSAAFKASQLFTGAGAIWGAGASLAQPIFHGGALRAQRKAALASYDASLAQYRQTVLNAFQNVADTLTAVQQDAYAAQSTQTAAVAAERSFIDIKARYQLGAAAYPATVASEQQWQNARLSDIQASASRLIDTAALFQALGTPPVMATDSAAKHQPAKR